VASLIPETIPVILESIVSAEFIDDEIEAAHEAWRQGSLAAGAKAAVRRDGQAWFTRSSPPALASASCQQVQLPGQPPRAPGGGLELRPKRIR